MPAIQVEHDPFSADATVGGVPVEHDPFAGAKEVPRFESTPTGAASGRVAEKRGLTPDQQKTLSKSRGDIEELLSSIVIGGALGTFSPELLTLGGAGISMIPGGAAIGIPVMGLGTAARGARLAATGLGALSGFGGEAGEKIAESQGAGPVGKTAAGLVGGAVTPEFASVAKLALKKMAAKMTGMWSTTSVDQIVNAVRQSITGERPLSADQKKYIEEQIKTLRGSAKPGEAETPVYDLLKKGSEKITATGEDEASAIRQHATERAAAIRDSAAQEAEKIRSSNSAEANRILSEGESKAKAITDEANRRLSKMEAARPKIKASGEKAIAEANESLGRVGSDRISSDIGAELRDKIVGIHGEKLKSRAAQYDADEFARNIEIHGKEELGQYPIDMPAYKNLLKDLKIKLATGKEALESMTSVSHTDPTIVRQYQAVHDALNWQRKVLTKDSQGNPLSFKRLPPDFNAVDEVRRKLGEAAFGAPAGGFEAIGQNEARNLYKRLSNILGEYAPAQKELIANYESAAKELDVFKSKAGTKATAAERFDPKRFRDDPSTLPSAFFRSKQSVSDLLELSGGDKAFVDRLAADHVASSLKGKNASAAKTWLDKQKDWLSDLPQLKEQAQSYVSRLEKAERTGKQASGAIEKLTSMEPRIQREAEAATKPLVETTVPRQARQIEKTAEQLAARTAAKGESEAGKVMSEAEKKASAASKIAQDRANTILGDSSPERRIEEILLSGSPKIWNEVAPILATDSNGKKHIETALRSVLAGKAEKSPKQIGEIFRKDVKPFLTGVLDSKSIATLEKQIAAIGKDAPEGEKLNRIAKLTAQAIAGEVAAKATDLPLDAIDHGGFPNVNLQ